MLSASDQQEFNDRFNKYAGTAGIEYAKPWDMHTHTGKQYLHEHHRDVGQKLADAVLSGGHKASSELIMLAPNSKLNGLQQAYLTLVRDSKTDEEFNSALYAAVRNNVLGNQVLALLTKHSSSQPTSNVMSDAEVERAQYNEHIDYLESLIDELVHNQIKQYAAGKAGAPAGGVMERMEADSTASMEVDSTASTKVPHLVDQSSAETGTLRIKKKRSRK